MEVITYWPERRSISKDSNSDAVCDVRKDVLTKPCITKQGTQNVPSVNLTTELITTSVYN